MPTITKTVIVQGYRSNIGQPQSWWNDTGIVINAGDELTITATDPNDIIIWSGNSGFGPAGDVDNIPNRDWPETLANRTGIVQDDTNCWFGSLIGKIGVNGQAFSIGVSRTLTPNISGTLFLGYNDGANFEDNSGSWEIEVSYPFNPDARVSVLSAGDTVSICSQPGISNLVIVGGNSLSQAACEDYFGFLDATGGVGLTYRELFAILLYTEFDTIRTSNDPDAQQVYDLVREALARQYYELAGADGVFSTPEELFEFLGGIEGWYGHHPTQMVGNRFPLVWLRDVMRARDWVESPNVQRTPFRENFVIPAVIDAYDNIGYIWDESAWNGENWSQGYGDCTQPARWGNVGTLPGNQLAHIDTPGGSSAFPFFIVQPPVGC